MVKLNKIDPKEVPILIHIKKPKISEFARLIDEDKEHTEMFSSSLEQFSEYFNNSGVYALEQDYVRDPSSYRRVASLLKLSEKEIRKMNGPDALSHQYFGKLIIPKTFFRLNELVGESVFLAEIIDAVPRPERFQPISITVSISRNLSLFKRNRREYTARGLNLRSSGSSLSLESAGMYGFERYFQYPEK